jgi:hypothetical protein
VQVLPIASPGTWEWNAYAGPNPGYGSTSKDFIFFVKTSGEDGGDLGGPCDDPIRNLDEFNQRIANGTVQKTEKALDFALLGAFPNPFNPATTIKFQMPQAGLVNLKVYDTAGRLVTTLVNGRRDAGAHEVTFDGSNLSSGVYLYSLTAGAYSATGKMVLVK